MAKAGRQTDRRRHIAKIDHGQAGPTTVLKAAKQVIAGQIGMDEVGETTVWDFDNFELRAPAPVEGTQTPEATTAP